MRLISTCALLLSLSAMPGLCQSNSSNMNSAVLPANASDSSVNYSALRERLASQNKTLQDQVNNQRAIVKKNQVLLKEAQRLDASNKKLMEEKKKLETENADLEKQRQSLKSSQSNIQSAAIPGSN